MRSDYDQIIPQYSSMIDLSYCKNNHILKWWSREHDQLLIHSIKNLQWYWYLDITDKILDITTNKEIENWKKSDPLCATYAYYNILMYFSISRAAKERFDEYLRYPGLIVCPVCGIDFKENQYPHYIFRRFGFNHANICPVCYNKAILEENTNKKFNKNEVLRYFKDLSEILERIPPKNFGNTWNDLKTVNLTNLPNLVKILHNKPTKKKIDRLFGSWLSLLIKAGLLQDGALKGSRGYRCLADDGHECYSLAEKTIDDLLYHNNIPHEKEPLYPDSNYRGDFMVNNTFIEYFGLCGDPEYDKKINIKRDLCKKNGINMVEIYPEDLIDIDVLKRRLRKIR